MFFVPYPSKIDGQTILAAAIKELAVGSVRELSLRNVAASLDVAPNAIYRYFPDRPVFESALADEAARRLELALRRSADGCDPMTALRRMAAAYITFARKNAHLYEVMMSRHNQTHEARCRESLWLFTVSQVQQIAGETRAKEASIALWALLHGMAVLENAPAFGEINVSGGLDFGLDAWVSAVSKAPLTRTDL